MSKKKNKKNQNKRVSGNPAKRYLKGREVSVMLGALEFENYRTAEEAVRSLLEDFNLEACCADCQMLFVAAATDLIQCLSELQMSFTGSLHLHSLGLNLGLLEFTFCNHGVERTNALNTSEGTGLGKFLLASDDQHNAVEFIGDLTVEIFKQLSKISPYQLAA